MKKVMMLVGLALAGVAGAQSWDVEDGKLTFVGCYGKQDGVYCDFSYVLTKKQTASFYWSPERFKVFKQDGTSQKADAMAFVDGKFGGIWGYSSTQEVIANVPLKVTAYFNTPSNISSFRALMFNDVKFDNIPVRPYGSAPAAAPKPTPVAAPIRPFKYSGYSITLTNCQKQVANVACTAVLTPSK
ncbi:hypothetical protein ACFP81_08650 [Deinococcus lacus]|uniref:Lipoprotein n=1 Tax=Deinococcus lacus TaxID=392561 RepID=A0ABW1YCJ6_9DEIO